MTPTDIPSERNIGQEEHRILRHLSTLPYDYGGFEEGPLSRMTFDKLESQGYIVHLEGHSTFNYRLTPAGWGWSEQVRLGLIRYWVKNNWFAATVAAATIVLSLGTLGLGIWNALQVDCPPR